MQFNYEISNQKYRRGMMIKHKGLPLYVGGKLVTPHSFVWWWPVNWLWGIILIPKAVKVIYKHFTEQEQKGE